MDERQTDRSEDQPEFNPELTSLEAANAADLSCPGCKVAPAEDE